MKSLLDKNFNIWKDKINKLIEEHPLQIISWEATRRCNLKCVHCGSPSENVNLSSELKTEEVIEAFEQIITEFDMTQFKHINITGGEPFVRKDLLKILEALSKHHEYRNIDIQTNGIFISQNPGVLKKLKKFGVTGLGISLDGLEDTHNNFRKIKDGFKKAVSAAQLAVQSGFVVTISVVAHSKNIHEISLLHDMVKEQIKPRIFRIMFIDPIGRAKYDSEYILSIDQIKWIINFLHDQYKQNCSSYHSSSTMMVELGCGGWFGKELEGTFRPFIFHCIAGINNLGILYDGKLASCSNVSRDFIEGDLQTDNIKDVWENRYQRYRNREWRKNGKCTNCSDWDFCHGGPMHLSSIENQQKCFHLKPKN